MFESLIPPRHWIFNGQPFALLDQVRIIAPGRTGEGEYRVQGTEPFLRGHFPGEPLVPGVILVEIVSRLSRLVAESDPGAKPARRLKLSALRIVKILGTAGPRELMHVEVSVTARSEDSVLVQGKITVSERELLSAEMTFSDA